ncbi:MAG: TetR/AcrR family transcriptional regulator [Pseudomonadota bacterium]
MTVEDKPKTRRRKAARPGEIVEAGLAEFAQHGFERARLDRIAKRAGIAKGTIYLYFPSKEALFTAAIEEYIVQTMAENDAVIDSFDGDTEDLVRIVLKTTYTNILRPETRAVMRIVIAEAERLPDISRQFHDMAVRKGLGILKKIVARGIKRGDLQENAATRTPQLIIAPAFYLAVNLMAFGQIEELDVDAYFEGHIEMVMRGMTNPE